MATLHVERVIAATPERVFDWLADPASITSVPLVFTCKWVNASAPGVGAVRQVTGAGVWFREEITAYERPHSYSYLIIRAFPPFDHDGGTLTFTPEGSGTRVDWDSTYRHPARAGGKALEFVTAPLLRSNFATILAKCAQALEG
jgi:uncharacterized protein YndB with AHSA1/START domain